MRNRILEVVRAAMRERSDIRITFKPGAILEVNRLLVMHDEGNIGLSATDEENLGIVQCAGRWDQDADRTIIVGLTDQFNEERFAKAFEYALENIGIVEPFKPRSV